MLQLTIPSKHFDIPTGLQKWIKKYNNNENTIIEIDVESLNTKNCSIHDTSFLMKLSKKILDELDVTYEEFSKSFKKTYNYTPTIQEEFLENNYNEVSFENTWLNIPGFTESLTLRMLKKISESTNGWYKEPINAYHNLSSGILRDKFNIIPKTNDIIPNPKIIYDYKKYNCYYCACSESTFLINSVCCNKFSCISCYMTDCTNCKFCNMAASPQKDIVIINDGTLQLPFSIYTGKFKSLMSNDLKISVESSNKKISDYIAIYAPILLPRNKDTISFERDIIKPLIKN